MSRLTQFSVFVHKATEFSVFVHKATECNSNATAEMSLHLTCKLCNADSDSLCLPVTG